jgi:hypothetical protein
LSTGHCSEPNIPPVGAILVIIGGDSFVHIIYQSKMMGKHIINAIADFKRSGVKLRIFKPAMPFGGMMASYMHLICHVL